MRTTRDPRPRLAAIIMTILSALAAACDDPAPSPAASAAPTHAATAAAPASGTAQAETPVEEPLTAEALVAANEVAKKGDPLTSAAAALYQELGKPTRTSASSMIWGVVGEDACTVLRVDHEGNQITEVHPAKTVSKSNAADFEACKRLLF